jgi:predicted RNA-binding protein YlxR (DUF448 family)
MKKVPLRMCIGCKEMKPKKELLRIVKQQNNSISVDLTGKKQGRGAYVCYNIECLEKAQKTKRLEKSFEQQITPEVFGTLREELEKINDK